MFCYVDYDYVAFSSPFCDAVVLFLCYSGHVSWIQDEKKILDHDFIKKSTSIIDLIFAIKYVDR